MTNLEKMNNLVRQNATKQQIKEWAYMNRILVCVLDLEQEFEPMANSVKAFMDTDEFKQCKDEHEVWDKFLDAEFKS